jgi:hypothetical protein
MATVRTEQNKLDDELLLMTELQFTFAVQSMRRVLSQKSIDAARRVLVYGESQRSVSNDTGIQPPQLSETVKSLRERLDQRCNELGLVKIEALVPKEFEAGIRAQEAYVLSPLLEPQKATGKRRKKKADS